MKRLLVGGALLTTILISCFSTNLIVHAQNETSSRDESTQHQEVTDWLNRQAMPIGSIEAGHGFADLEPLKKTLAGIRVVGLGEATHGTREFFQFKHRMIEFLVREMNFTIFAIEASYSTSLRVNDYVMGGKVSRAEALQSLGFQVWQTEEVAALVDWLRDYNQTVPANRKVRFYGYDMQDMGGPWEVVMYLQRVVPEKAEETNDLIKRVTTAVQASFGGSKEGLKLLVPEIDALIRYFVLREASFVLKTSRADYDEKLHRLRLLAQCVDFFCNVSGEVRDRYMAENILYMLSRESGDQRVAVWAHNSHISTGTGEGGGKAMGNFLRERLGSSYYAFGFVFDHGSFQAMANMPTGGTQYVEYEVGAAGKESVNSYFAQCGYDNYIIDIRNSPRTPSVTEWLDTPRGLGWAGGYNVAPNLKEAWASGNFLKSTIGKEFDAVIFIKQTTRARPLSKEALATH